ncbi:MAG: hypothetical protein KAR42_17850 [candidate division Zixibacteria bacterium]|nr:hypothetical protein [candidate division Zixibacteria bacterium]
MKTHRKSQNQKIRRHLINGYTITQREASRLYGCDRLASRINDLRNGRFGIELMLIETTMIHKKGKHWAEYSIMH